VIFLTYHWQMMIIGLVLMLPSARLVLWWVRQGSSVAPLDYIVSSFAQGFWFLTVIATGSALLAWLLASLLLYIIFLGVFGAGSYYAWFWFFELLRWGLFCFVEEIWKVRVRPAIVPSFYLAFMFPQHGTLNPPPPAPPLPGEDKKLLPVGAGVLEVGGESQTAVSYEITFC